jgi:hypothetical protein
LRLSHTDSALRRIIDRRLYRAELSKVAVDEIIDSEAINGLVSVYDQSGHNLRQVLNVLQLALDHAVDEQAELLTFPHIRHGIQTARPTRHY